MPQMGSLGALDSVRKTGSSFLDGQVSALRTTRITVAENSITRTSSELIFQLFLEGLWKVESAWKAIIDLQATVVGDSI